MRAAQGGDGVATGDVHVQRSFKVRTAAFWSIGAHAALIAGAIMAARLSAPAPLPPAYSVELVAAPAGPRAVGAVQRGPVAPPAAEPEPVVPTPAAPISEPTVAPASKRAAARKETARNALTPPRTAAPKAGAATARPGVAPAGGGPTGGRGADVASVKVQGIAFPFPGYLENITRQIALNFKPRPGAALRAEVTFLIHRDGSVSDLRLLSRSGVYAFDLECIGAVEAVGQRRSFGVLPSGFRDDVLPVVFSFDPSVLR